MKKKSWNRRARNDGEHPQQNMIIHQVSQTPDRATPVVVVTPISVCPISFPILLKDTPGQKSVILTFEANMIIS